MLDFRTRYIQPIEPVNQINQTTNYTTNKNYQDTNQNSNQDNFQDILNKEKEKQYGKTNC